MVDLHQKKNPVAKFDQIYYRWEVLSDKMRNFTESHIQVTTVRLSLAQQIDHVVSRPPLKVHTAHSGVQSNGQLNGKHIP